jgi:hypothetical protein
MWNGIGADKLQRTGGLYRIAPGGTGRQEKKKEEKWPPGNLHEVILFCKYEPE